MCVYVHVCDDLVLRPHLQGPQLGGEGGGVSARKLCEWAPRAGSVMVTLQGAAQGRREVSMYLCMCVKARTSGGYSQFEPWCVYSITVFANSLPEVVAILLSTYFLMTRRSSFPIPNLWTLEPYTATKSPEECIITALMC